LADDIPRKVAVMVAGLVDAPYAELWFSDEKTESVLLAAVNDDTYLTEEVPRAVLAGQCIPGEIVSSGTLRVCPDLVKVPSWSRKEWSARKGLVSLLGVPIYFEDRVIGALSVLGRSRSQLGPSELQTLQFLADQTAVALLRKRTENALVESEEKARIFFDAALDAVITMAGDGLITGWNVQAEATFGWSRQETIGQSIYDTIIAESHREEYELWLGHLMEAGEDQISNTRIDITAMHKDGSELPVELTISPVRVGQTVTYTVFLRDIRERKEIVETLKQVNVQLVDTKRSLNGMVDISPDPIISTDENGEVTLFSKSAETLLGYRGDDIIGNHIAGIYENGDWATDVMELMRESGGSVSDFETSLIASDGTLVPVSITASILYDEDGAETGTVGFQKDLRDVMRMEEEIQTTQDELQRVLEALENAQAAVAGADKLAALGRLTAGVSHEILNPLNIITLRLHMMIKDPDLPPDVSRHLRVLDDQAGRISKIAQDLLYFARQRDPETRPLNLKGVVDRTLGLLEHDLRQSNISLDLRLTSGLPAVKGDEDQLQQVVLNLLTNARDAMPRGGALSISTCEVQKELKRFVELRIEDTGEGIPPDKIDKIFDPFFTTKPEGEGTGLGLAICRGIIESHGGEIWAEPGTAGGAAFIIRLGTE
jgi:PAS domain S-box-containing protein